MRNIITIGLLIGCVFLGKAQNEADKWLKAVSAQQGIAIEWQERPTSFAKKGIKSFVGYYKGDFVASLSVGKSVSGSFNYQGTSYEISDSKGQLVFYKSEQGVCGNQDKEPHKHSAFARPVLAAEEAQPKIANTQVLRVYRLAMHIPYSTFTTVMSYGSPRDFFSLSSIERIRQRLTQVPAKAKDKTFATQAPRIDRSKLKNHYTIPKGTFFQFYIPATDPDSAQLLYAVNQHDVRNGAETPITQYAIYKPTTTNPVTIKTEYHENSGNVVANSGLAHQTTGTFTFWLGVSDAEPQQAADYIVQYDLAETKVTVKEGTPFEITTTPKNKYKGGEKISLQWKVDATIFTGTKVRVLLSDDLGKTFKHIVLAETANDGAEEVTLPNINTSKAVLKVEVIEGVAFALTDYNPKTGGFTIEKDNNLASEPLAFVAATLPQDLNLSCAKEVPTAVMPTTTGGCASVSYRMEEKKTAVLCDNRFTLLRIFTATDGCTTLTHTQTIKVADNIPPTFVGTLPQDITIEEGEPIPLQKSISAEDTCAGAPTVKRSMREELNEEGKRVKIIYQWVARDVCGNEAVHTQTISITPKKVVPPAPNDTAEVLIYNGVSTDDANNYFRIANTDPNSPISVIIFDEMGLKVYESDHYQERGEVFRGYPNVKSVIGSNKALAGTYFYIVKYYKNGKQESAKGFLYVR